jgi:hypothetical protein
MKLFTYGKQQHIQQPLGASCKEGEEDVWGMTNMMFEEWLWMMAKEEGGVRVFVGSQKGFGTLSNGARLRHHETTLSHWLLFFFFLFFFSYQKSV